MDIFFTFCFIIIMINQFVIQVKLMDIEDRMKLILKNDEHFQKWCRDAINYIFSTRR